MIPDQEEKKKKVQPMNPDQEKKKMEMGFLDFAFVFMCLLLYIWGGGPAGEDGGGQDLLGL